jgi:two-component system KDP operon response regulator KdpE
VNSDSILIIEDDPQIRVVVRGALRGEAAEVLEAASAAQGTKLAEAARPKLVVLDLILPDGAGIDVCREIRRWSGAPIVVLSARHAEREKVDLLDAGADDYITKPFSTLELQARVRAQLRRAQMQQPANGPGPLKLAELVVDVAARQVLRDAELLRLTPTEWDLLVALVRHAGRTLTHRQLHVAVWGSAHVDPQQNLRVHVANLRRKLERDPVRPRFILTEPYVGYRFEIPEG